MGSVGWILRWVVQHVAKREPCSTMVAILLCRFQRFVKSLFRNFSPPTQFLPVLIGNLLPFLWTHVIIQAFLRYKSTHPPNPHL